MSLKELIYINRILYGIEPKLSKKDFVDSIDLSFINDDLAVNRFLYIGVPFVSITLSLEDDFGQQGEFSFTFSYYFSVRDLLLAIESVCGSGYHATSIGFELQAPNNYLVPVDTQDFEPLNDQKIYYDKDNKLSSFESNAYINGSYYIRHDRLLQRVYLLEYDPSVKIW